MREIAKPILGLDVRGIGLQSDDIISATIVKFDGRFTLSSTSAASAKVTLAAIDSQRIAVATDVTAFDVSGAAGQASRLYQTASACTPDASGLSNPVDALDHGLSRHDLTATCLGSAAFVPRYGTNLSIIDFVTELYLDARPTPPCRRIELIR